MFMVAPSEAIILWDEMTTFGNIEKLKKPFYPPTEEYIDQGIAVPFSKNIWAFDEKQNVIIPRTIKIAKENPNYIEVKAFANYEPENLSDSNLAYDWDAELNTLPELQPGNQINSHFIAFGYRQQPPYKCASASLTFDSPIIGLIDTRDSYLTDDLFSLTNYSDPNFPQTLEGLKWNQNNFTKLSEDEEFFFRTRDYVKIAGEYHNILEIRLVTTGYEGLRILTSASVLKFPPHIYTAKKSVQKIEYTEEQASVDCFLVDGTPS